LLQLSSFYQEQIRSLAKYVNGCCFVLNKSGEFMSLALLNANVFL